jgi:hypothetical protein
LRTGFVVAPPVSATEPWRREFIQTRKILPFPFNR